MDVKKIFLCGFLMIIFDSCYAQKDTTYFIFNGDVRKSIKVIEDTINYDLLVRDNWFDIVLFGKNRARHELFHSSKRYSVKNISQHGLPLLKRAYNLFVLCSMSEREFINKFDYLQYNHVYFIIPLKELDEKGYKAYEFTFSSYFLCVE